MHDLHEKMMKSSLLIFDLKPNRPKRKRKKTILTGEPYIHRNTEFHDGMIIFDFKLELKQHGDKHSLFESYIYMVSRTDKND